MFNKSSLNKGINGVLVFEIDLDKSLHSNIKEYVGDGTIGNNVFENVLDNPLFYKQFNTSFFSEDVLKEILFNPNDCYLLEFLKFLMERSTSSTYKEIIRKGVKDNRLGLGLLFYLFEHYEDFCTESIIDHHPSFFLETNLMLVIKKKMGPSKFHETLLRIGINRPQYIRDLNYKKIYRDIGNINSLECFHTLTKDFYLMNIEDFEEVLKDKFIFSLINKRGLFTPHIYKLIGKLDYLEYNSFANLLVNYPLEDLFKHNVFRKYIIENPQELELVEDREGLNFLTPEIFNIDRDLDVFRILLNAIGKNHSVCEIALFFDKEQLLSIRDHIIPYIEDKDMDNPNFNEVVKKLDLCVNDCHDKTRLLKFFEDSIKSSDLCRLFIEGSSLMRSEIKMRGYSDLMVDHFIENNKSFESAMVADPYLFEELTFESQEKLSSNEKYCKILEKHRVYKKGL